VPGPTGAAPARLRHPAPPHPPRPAHPRHRTRPARTRPRHSTSLPAPTPPAPRRHPVGIRSVRRRAAGACRGWWGRWGSGVRCR